MSIFIVDSKGKAIAITDEQYYNSLKQLYPLENHKFESYINELDKKGISKNTEIQKNFNAWVESSVNKTLQNNPNYNAALTRNYYVLKAKLLQDNPIIINDKSYDPFLLGMPELNLNYQETPCFNDTDTNDFYKSTEWKRLRYMAFKKYGTKCQLCGKSAKDEVKIHVDHIKPRSKYPELALDIKNLQILCEDCNLAKGAWDSTKWR